jgi:hypothetical protein
MKGQLGMGGVGWEERLAADVIRRGWLFCEPPIHPSNPHPSTHPIGWPRPTPPCSYGKTHDMEGVRGLMKTAVNYRHEVFQPAPKKELEGLIRESKCV